MPFMRTGPAGTRPHQLRALCRTETGAGQGAERPDEGRGQAPAVSGEGPADGGTIAGRWTGGPRRGSAHHAGRLGIRGLGSSKLTLSVSEYPAPPSDIALSPEAETMYHRYMGYRQRQEPLPAMAYFCLSMLEDPPAGNSRERKINGNKRKVAAKKYRIDEGVLNKIGELSSKRGEVDARKREGTDLPLSSAERSFLDRAVKAIIRRVAEWEHAPGDNLPELSWSDLPPLDDGAPARA